MKKKKLISIIGFICTLIIVAIYFPICNIKNDILNIKLKAASGSKSINNYAGWSLGASTNVSISSDPNSNLNISNKTLQYNDIAGDIITSNIEYSGDLEQIFDLGQIFTNVSRVWFSAAGPAGTLSFSTNNSSWTIATFLSSMWQDIDFSPLDVRYVKITDTCSYLPVPCVIDEMRLYKSSASATHTSASTQIDAGAGVSGWTTFAPSATIPANTAVSFRFRTSPDATNWTSWSSSVPYAASIDISGQNSANRYMQVESTLSNTDGASTPTLSSYTVNYNSAILDHVVVSPSSAAVKVGGATSFTATAYDDSNNAMSGATFTWSSDCGSVSAGSFTAPTTAGSCSVVAETTINSVTKSSSATVTVTADEPVINPYICPASTSNCYEQANDKIYSCQAGKAMGSDEYYACENAWCSNVNSCQANCGGGNGADTPLDIRIIRPTTGTYLSKNNITIRWDFGAKNSTVQGRAENRTFELLTSIDDGATWQDTLRLYPMGLYSTLVTNIAAKTAVYDNSNFIKPPASGGYGEYLFNPKDFPELIGKTVKFKLEAIVLGGAGCMQPINSASSNNIEIKKAAEKLTISLRTAKTEAENITAYPGTEVEVSVNVQDDLNNDLTADSTINFDLKNGGKIIRYGTAKTSFLNNLIQKAMAAGGENTVTIKVGDEVGYYKDALTVTASAGDLTNSKTVDINVVALPAPVCDTACQIKDGILGVVSAENTNKSAPLFLTLLSALGIALLGGLTNALPTVRMSEVGGLWWQSFKGLFVRGNKRIIKKIGRVYDALSGLAIPLAYVMLVRTNDGRIVETAVSDKNGEFYLTIPENGDYHIRIKKSGFAMADEERKSLVFRTALKYDNNYFGESVTAKKDGLVFAQSIPLISAYDKPISAKEIFSLERVARFLRIINYPLIAFGLSQTILSVVKGANLSNLIILGLYAITILWYLINLLVVNGRDWGVIYNEETGSPVDLAIIRAVSTKSGKLVKTAVTDAAGRYSLVLAKGEYKIYVSKSGYLQEKPLVVKIRSSLATRKDNLALLLIGTAMPDSFEKQPADSRMFESVSQIIDGFEGKLGA